MPNRQATDVARRVTRVLIVGCPRSGTTLLQSLLVAHPDVVGFPELHVFADLRPRHPLGQRLGLSRQGSADLMRRLEPLGLRVGIDPPHPVTWRGWSRRVIGALDAAAVGQHARAWVEKTPRHLYQARDLQRLADIHVVHVIRSGPATIASLREVTRRHPDAWGGARTLEQCIARWVRDVNVSHRAVGQPQNYFVSYEHLTAQPVAVIGRLFQALGLDSTAEVVRELVASRTLAGSKIVLPDEPWKARVGQTIRNDTEKWRAILAIEEQRRVLSDTRAWRDLDSAFRFL